MNLWFLRDPASIAVAKGLKEVAPFYVEQEAPAPPGGLPQPGKLEVRLRNEHLQYVVTWYGLALVLAVVFAVWARSSLRGAGKARESGIYVSNRSGRSAEPNCLCGGYGFRVPSSARPRNDRAPPSL